MTVGRWLPLFAIVVLSGVFAYLNGGERIALNLGFATFYRVSLVAVTFGAFILGMVTMFLIGLRHDLRVRRMLRERDRWLPPPPADEPRISEWRSPRV